MQGFGAGSSLVFIARMPPSRLPFYGRSGILRPGMTLTQTFSTILAAIIRCGLTPDGLLQGLSLAIVFHNVVDIAHLTDGAEWAALQTGTGKNDQYTAASGKKVHRFFWGLGSAVWNNDGDAAVLFEMRTWKTTRA